eukprot:TRINITY_DN40541_c0_g1_i1.p1 TRINITY_DN40541_c0_g1~~TRINITY_DN40541_c0_g1_i1.p1  ORF type:complete len:972 (+),score=217.24 TRINITY_DN40541_c0_g1_i1:56-2917(+)
MRARRLGRWLASVAAAALAAAQGADEVCTHAPYLHWPRQARGRITSFRVLVRDEGGATHWDSGTVFQEDTAYNGSNILGGCMWRNTGSCSPEGTREPQFDRDCTAPVPSGASGFCACGAGRRVRFGCQRRQPHHCWHICTAPPPPRPTLPRGPGSGRCKNAEVWAGSVVKRNPQWWKWDDQDGGEGMTGTVIGIASESPGWVRVQWEAGASNSYRCGAQGAHDLIVVRNPDGTDPAPEVLCSGRLVQNGAVVRRNRAHWQWGDQDGGPGGLGTVMGVRTRQGGPKAAGGWVRVKWDAGLENVYRCGVQGSHDLIVIGDGQASSQPVRVWLRYVSDWGELGGWENFLTRPKARAFAVSRAGYWGAAWGAESAAEAAESAAENCRKECTGSCAPCAVVWQEDVDDSRAEEEDAEEPPPQRRRPQVGSRAAAAPRGAGRGEGEEAAVGPRRRLLQAGAPRGGTPAPSPPTSALGSELAFSYAGPPLQPGMLYTAELSEWENPAGATQAGRLVSSTPAVLRFRTCADLPSAREEVRSLLSDPRLQHINASTADSLRTRIKANGYVPTSVAQVQSSYPGMFTRDTCAFLIALLAIRGVGDLDRVALVLRFLLNIFRKNKLKQVPRLVQDNGKGGFRVTGHVAGNPITVDQPDSAFHLVVTWGRYLQASGDEEMARLGWSVLRPLFDQYLPLPGLPPPKHWSERLRLIWNPNLEHSRLSIFLSTYDMLTNAWAVEACRWMAWAAEDVLKVGGRVAADYRAVQSIITEGIDASLSADVDGEKVYGELRYHDSPDELVTGFSFVNTAPISAAGTDAVDQPRMDATMRAYWRRGSLQWREVPRDKRWAELADGPLPPPGPLLSELVPESFAAGSGAGRGSHVVLTKGLAWELAYAARRSWWPRVLALLRWLARSTYTPAVGEMYYYEDYLRGRNWEHDPANAEQGAWFLWAMHIVERSVAEV